MYGDFLLRIGPTFDVIDNTTLACNLATFDGLLVMESDMIQEMGETEMKDTDAYEEELLDYEEEDEKAPDSAGVKVNGEAVKKGYVGIHSSGFRDFLLKPELLRAIVDSGFEHPSEGK
ncbi:unnamed protein product [Lactuca virosa]|uniref:DEAD-box RNA helicase Q domain-containing protein n=1 Tax=Lactuca virosa TaxID=75947 RepID=A0AAU9M913_9ASTR|nr:unnamed protein product [Lactuca virosa]